MQAIARYDDAAKQLITVGGFMQGGLIAVYSVVARQQSLTNTCQKIGIICFEIFFITFLSFAAWVCSLQPEMQAKRITELLQKAVENCLSKMDLAGEVKNWCGTIEHIVEKKRLGMLTAKFLFIMCSITMSGLLISPLLTFWQYVVGLLYVPSLALFIYYLKQLWPKREQRQIVN